MELVLARTSEQGSRQLIWASIGGKDNVDQLRGAYISSMQIQEPSDFVVTEEGKHAQTKLWVNNHLSYYRITTDKHAFAVRTLWLTNWRRKIHSYGKLLKTILRFPNNELTSRTWRVGGRAALQAGGLCLSEWGNNPQFFYIIPRNILYTAKIFSSAHNYFEHILGGPLTFIWVRRLLFTSPVYFYVGPHIFMLSRKHFGVLAEIYLLRENIFQPKKFIVFLTQNFWFFPFLDCQFALIM